MYDELYLKAPNASYYLKGRGYTEEDFVRVVVPGAGTDMQGFYDRYIRGVEPLPYDAAFAVVGLAPGEDCRRKRASSGYRDRTDRSRTAPGSLADCMVLRRDPAFSREINWCRSEARSSRERTGRLRWNGTSPEIA